jgi:FkbM family methyltransferase
MAAEPGLHGVTVNVGVRLADFEGMAFLLHYLKPADLFVDVGANAGAYALLAASRGAAVVAVEPNAKSRAFLQRSLALNGLAADVVGKAVTDRGGAVHMDLRLDATASIVEAGSQSAVEVPATTLDDLVRDRPVKLLKIDVEGAEPLVLAGGPTTLGRTEALLVETWGSAELHSEIESLGFVAVSYDPWQRRLSPWAAAESAQNVLFVRDVRAAAAVVAASPQVRMAGRLI